MLNYQNQVGAEEHGNEGTLDIGEALGDYSIRIKVRKDFYRKQSYGKCEVWNGVTLTWNEVSSILPSEVHDVWEAAGELRARAYAVLIGPDPD